MREGIEGKEFDGSWKDVFFSSGVVLKFDLCFVVVGVDDDDDDDVCVLICSWRDWI